MDSMIVTFSVVLGCLSSVISLVATCVRQWAYHDHAGVPELHGIWYICVDSSCEPISDAPAWIYVVRVMMVCGIVSIAFGTAFLVVYKFWKNKGFGLAASSLYLIAGFLFFMAVAIYGGKEAAQSDFRFMYFYNAFYFTIVTSAACLLGGILSLDVVRRHIKGSRYEEIQ